MSGWGEHRSRIAAVGGVLLALVVAGVAVLLAAGSKAAPAGGGGAASDASSDPGTSLGGRAAPGFTLRNQFGEPVSLAGLRGRAVLLAFVDSRCTTICPLTTTALLDAQTLLGSAGSRVALVGIDANPEAITVADVRSYSAAHGMLHRWNFLTGTRRQLDAVWRAYHVYVAATTTGIDHEPVIYLIDPAGRERFLFVTPMAYTGVWSQAVVLARSTSAVLPGRPGVSGGAPAATAVVPPSRPVTFTPVPAGEQVTLGPGHPHLVLFFDTWLTQTSDLTAELLGLNEYVRAAARHGWPSLLAVDEAPVETGPVALSGYLHALAGRLRYPVVVDATGALADGYGVGDQPWFDLTSTTGTVLFSNDGWFPIRGLEAAVSRAETRR